jgi:hypothetical protein
MRKEKTEGLRNIQNKKNSGFGDPETEDYGYSISFNVLSASSFMRADILLDDE